MHDAIQPPSAQACQTLRTPIAGKAKPPVSILIVEDQPLTLAGIKLSLADIPAFSVVAEAASGADAVSEAMRTAPNVVLMDVELPQMDGIEATRAIKKMLPKTRIVMFTSHTSPSIVFSALKAGADGFLSKNRALEEITAAIRSVHQGVWWLDPEVADTVALASVESAISFSKVESFVLSSLRDGMTIVKLAAKLGATEDAITSVIKGIFKQFAAVPEPSFEPSDHATNEQPAIGDLFEDKYLIEEVAGKGGAGTVYRAQHIYMEREVAIKVLHSPLLKDPAVLTSFRQEAMAVACLEHPSIIRVYDFGVSASGFPYLVMEYAKAITLRQMLQAQPRLDQTQFTEIFIPICEALRSAHALNVIHCDLKPTNILVKQFESGLLPKLADFGLAKFVKSEEVLETPTQHSGTRVVEGTPPYMSPEQCLADPLDQCSDIYSLGCVMYEALTGRPVFFGKDAMETFHQHLNKPAMPLNRVLQDVKFPPQLEALIDSMLKKERQSRIQTMDEVCSILQSIASS